jgi:hypothetical protein
MNTLYEVQARVDDLHRRAERERLAAIVRAERPSRATNLYIQGRRNLGQALIWLGSRLDKPVCQPVEPTPSGRMTPAGSTTFALSECC